MKSAIPAPDKSGIQREISRHVPQQIAVFVYTAARFFSLNLLTKIEVNPFVEIQNVVISTNDCGGIELRQFKGARTDDKR